MQPQQTNPLSVEQQLRFQLAGRVPVNNIEDADKVFQWVMGPKQPILPVSTFEVVKK